MPRLGPFELPGQPDERRFLSPPGGEVHPDREPRFGPVQRHRHGRLAARVADPGVGREPRAAPAELERIAAAVDQRAKLDRWLPQGSGQPQVVPVEVRAQVAHRALHVLDREQVVVRAERPPAFGERPHERLEMLGFGGSAGSPLPVGDRPCRTGREQGGELHPQLFGVVVGARFLDHVAERFAQRRRIVHRPPALRIDRIAQGRFDGEADPERSR